MSDERNIFISGRVADLTNDQIARGVCFTTDKCSDCGATVAVTKTGAAILTHEPGLRILCHVCAAPVFAEAIKRDEINQAIREAARRN